MASVLPEEVVKMFDGSLLQECSGLVVMLSDDLAQVNRLWMWYSVAHAVNLGLLMIESDTLLTAWRPHRSDPGPKIEFH
eukprot:3872794-Amphidinium_carterae.1